MAEELDISFQDLEISKKTTAPVSLQQAKGRGGGGRNEGRQQPQAQSGGVGNNHARTDSSNQPAVSSRYRRSQEYQDTHQIHDQQGRQNFGRDIRRNDHTLRQENGHSSEQNSSKDFQQNLTRDHPNYEQGSSRDHFGYNQNSSGDNRGNKPTDPMNNRQNTVRDHQSRQNNTSRDNRPNNSKDYRSNEQNSSRTNFENNTSRQNSARNYQSHEQNSSRGGYQEETNGIQGDTRNIQRAGSYGHNRAKETNQNYSSNSGRGNYHNIGIDRERNFEIKSQRERGAEASGNDKSRQQSNSYEKQRVDPKYANLPPLSQSFVKSSNSTPKIMALTLDDVEAELKATSPLKSLMDCVVYPDQSNTLNKRNRIATNEPPKLKAQQIQAPRVPIRINLSELRMGASELRLQRETLMHHLSVPQPISGPMKREKSDARLQRETMLEQTFVSVNSGDKQPLNRQDVVKVTQKESNWRRKTPVDPIICKKTRENIYDEYSFR